VGLFELAAFPALCSGKSPTLITEHLTFKQRVRQSCTINFYERFAGAVGFIIQALGDKFLTDAGFTENDGIQTRIGDLIDKPYNFLNILTYTD